MGLGFRDDAPDGDVMDVNQAGISIPLNNPLE